MRLKILLLSLFAFLSAFAFQHCSKKDSDEQAATPAVEPVIPPATPDAPAQPAKSGDVVIGTRYHTGLVHKPGEEKGLGRTYVSFADDDCANLPKTFDLRTLGLVAPIKDQGQCGSCWSFSKTGSLESAMLGIGKTLDLSEQQLVSCDTGEYGCSGGNLDDFSFQISKGQATEHDFPYTASDSRCKSGLQPAAKGVSFSYIGAAGRAPTDKELMCALYKYKTVPWITVGATGNWDNPPSSEHTAYNHCAASETNHAVGVVGWWTTDSGKVEYIMKNSWGTGWGDKGYMSLPLGCNSFGDEVAFIQVTQPPAPTPTPGPSPTPNPSPTVTPCVPPQVKLPSLTEIMPGTQAMLGVAPTAGWSYSWSDGTSMVGTDSMIYVSPTKDTVYKLTATSSCGSSSSSEQVVIRLTKKLH